MGLAISPEGKKLLVACAMILWKEAWGGVHEATSGSGRLSGDGEAR